MGIHKFNDNEFEDLKSAIVEQSSMVELHRLLSGYKRTVEILKKEQNELLSKGKHDEANQKNRGILQAEKMIKHIEQSDKFKRGS